VTGRALVAPERKKENPYLWASSYQTPHQNTLSYNLTNVV
jgi:hypothetical protein